MTSEEVATMAAALFRTGAVRDFWDRYATLALQTGLLVAALLG